MKTTKLSITIPDQLNKALEEMAKQQRRTVSDILETYLYFIAYPYFKKNNIDIEKLAQNIKTDYDLIEKDIGKSAAKEKNILNKAADDFSEEFDKKYK
ncbi:MAG: ribbon-helix-helix protein, CopG family [Spirochaetes bacterium]|nr:ribbon-helix-helix protein, CopG family [Spirochaetota bacterium]